MAMLWRGASGEVRASLRLARDVAPRAALGQDPQVRRACVEDDLKLLRRRADRDRAVVLRVLEVVDRHLVAVRAGEAEVRGRQSIAPCEPARRLVDAKRDPRDAAVGIGRGRVGE